MGGLSTLGRREEEEFKYLGILFSGRLTGGWGQRLQDWRGES